MHDVFLNSQIKDDWTLQLVLMEAYDQGYGIFDHESFDATDPLAVIGMHPAENPVTGGRMELLARELMACRIPELTNTPLLELMNYPRWMLEPLLKDGRKAKVKDQAEMKQLEEGMAAQQRANENAAKGF